MATTTIQIVADLRQCTDDICATIRYPGNGYLVGMLKSVVGTIHKDSIPVKNVTGFIIAYCWYQGVSFNV